MTLGKILKKPTNLITGLGLILALTLAIVPPEIYSEELTTDTVWTGALALGTIVLFATGIIPEFITAIIFFAIAMLFSLAPASIIFSGFQSAGFWMVFGGLVIGSGISSTGLAQRLAHHLKTRFGTGYAGVISGIMLIAVSMAFLMPSTLGRLMILLPIVFAMAEGFGYRVGSNGRAGMVLAVSFGTMIPGFAIMSATVPAMVVIGTADTLYNIRPTYGAWLLLHFPILGALKAIVITILIVWLFPDNTPNLKTAEVGYLQTMAKRERTMALLLVLALVAWMTDFIHHVSPAWVALGVAGIMIMPFLGIVNIQKLQENINFGSLFYLGGVLGLGALVAHGGVGDFLAQTVIPLMQLSPGQDKWNFAAIAGLSSILAMFVTQPGSPAILTPLASSIAEAAALPVETVLMLTVVGYTTVILPYQTPPLVIAMQLGGVPIGKGSKLCLFLLLITVFVLLPLDYLWWRLLGWLP